jgi:ABC-2 type transport system ATP-binding protein
VAMVGKRDRIALTAGGNVEAGADAARRLPAVGEVTVHDGAVDVLTEDAGSLLPELLRVMGEAGASITGVEVVEPDLEAVFLHLTGKALRD